MLMHRTSSKIKYRVFLKVFEYLIEVFVFVFKYILETSICICILYFIFSEYLFFKVFDPKPELKFLININTAHCLQWLKAPDTGNSKTFSCCKILLVYRQ